MRAFIEDFRMIRVESEGAIETIENKDYVFSFVERKDNHHYFETDRDIVLHETDRLKINGEDYPLEIGLVTLKKAFEERFRYDGPLGYVYHKTHTDFYLFTPVAKEVRLNLGDASYPMTYEEPIYRIRVSGDHAGKPYDYDVRLSDSFHRVRDPYANAQGKDDKNYVIDLALTKTLEEHPVVLKKYTDAVLYEGHVRDMTIGLDVASKGLFQGLCEQSDRLGSSVLEYVKDFGATHLQLLPVFDFFGVDENDKERSYNWGYNPRQFFVVQGWFAKDPKDPYARINAFKTLIDRAHALGLGINMDVVFNHVYQRAKFPYDYLVPGYFFRHDQHGTQTDASYCGNDIETRNYMVRRLIVDNLVYWAEAFRIDGFRFDLMGLLDVDTMHAIEDRLKRINPSIMLYGEGWNMSTEVPAKKRSNMANHRLMPGYAFFNDFFRNTLKGPLHEAVPGFTTGHTADKHLMKKALNGSPHLLSSPAQSINYVECHDNMTFYDQMLRYLPKDDALLHRYQDFANHLVVIASGIPFFHAGQEFYRSKQGVENAYRSPDDINKIEWKPKLKSVSELKSLIALRKEYPVYRDLERDVDFKFDHHVLIYRFKDPNHVFTHYVKFDQGLVRKRLEGGNVVFGQHRAKVTDDMIEMDAIGLYIVRNKVSEE
jgi:pullulanase